MKNTHRIQFFSYLQVLVTLLCLFTFSADVDAKKGKKKADKASTINIVKTVDKKKQTITVDKKTYVMSDRVVITVDGKKATLAQVKVGMKVRMTSKVITYGKGTADHLYEASRVSAVTVKKEKK